MKKVKKKNWGRGLVFKSSTEFGNLPFTEVARIKFDPPKKKKKIGGEGKGNIEKW